MSILLSCRHLKSSKCQRSFLWPSLVCLTSDPPKGTRPLPVPSGVSSSREVDSITREAKRSWHHTQINGCKLLHLPCVLRRAIRLPWKLLAAPCFVYIPPPLSRSGGINGIRAWVLSRLFELLVFSGRLPCLHGDYMLTKLSCLLLSHLSFIDGVSAKNSEG